MAQYKAIGWVRDKQGNVLRYKLKDVCNCITQFSDGTGYKDPETLMANTAPYILILHDDDTKEIRRLTFREVYRLMGLNEAEIDLLLSKRLKSEMEDYGQQMLLFDDDVWAGMVDNDGLVPVIPPAEHYKLAGNSIVVDVLTAIYRQLLPPPHFIKSLLSRSAAATTANALPCAAWVPTSVWCAGRSSIPKARSRCACSLPCWLTTCSSPRPNRSTWAT